jgi:TRAP-type C4-dicarboxylate transport system substrate-binding protein
VGVRIVAGVWVIVAGAALVGCTSENLTRAGVEPPPTVLRIGVADAQGRFTDAVAQEFARGVAEMSDGALRVDIARGDDPVRRWNQRLAQRVIAGEVELALVPAQAWDALGVSSFSPLYVPFLISTDALLNAVATDPVVLDMLPGLDSLGLTGLALVPAGLRHVFAPFRPLGGAADYAGVGIRVAYSDTVWGYFQAVGAVPDDPNGPEIASAVRTGRIAGIDSMFGIVDDFIEAPATLGDIVTHPHLLTVVANARWYGTLTARQRESLREAAAATVAWSVRQRPTDGEEARRLCQRVTGAVVGVGGSALRAELREVAQPVIAAVRADARLDGLVRRIENLDAALGHPSATVTPCVGPALVAPVATGAASSPGEFPDGVYRRRVTTESLVDAGLSRSVAAEHAGVWTLAFDHGRLVDPGCPGSTYTTEADRIVIRSGSTGPSCGEAAGLVLFSAGWRLIGDELTFVDVRSGHGSDALVRAVFGGGPWTRIG